MSSERQAGQKRGRFQTVGARGPGGAARQDQSDGGCVEAARLSVYLLDADDELASELDVRMRLAARQMATARVLDAAAGESRLEPWFEAVGNGPGLLILDGLLAAETRIADRAATELLGAGDLLQPTFQRPEEMLEQMTVFRALLGTRFALLDADFLDRTRPWPQITRAIVRRAERRTDDLAMLRTISCQPRLEVRLVLLLWHLAARWGRVEPSGLRLSLPLTHRLLGQLVAAERPSISHALGRLTRAGLLSGETTDMHLQGSLDDHLHTLDEAGARLPLHHTARQHTSRQHLA
jgi:hypothetical protein